MKKAVLIVVAVAFLGILFIVSNHADNVQKEAYVSQVVIDATWGKELGQFGIYEPPEGGPTVGPVCFTVAPNADIYIEDGINRRIQMFSPEGKYLNVLSNIQGAEYDFCVDRDGNTYVLYKGIVPSQVWKYDQKGSILKKYKLLRGGGGTLYCDSHGELFISSYSPPTVYQFGTITSDLAPEAQQATLRDGFIGSNNVVLNQRLIFQTKDSELQLVNDSSRAIKKFSAYRMNLGQAGFTGIDEQMNVYTTSGNTIRKYSPAGDLMAEFTIQKKDYIWTSRSLYLDEHGNVYVMSTSKDGLKIIKWSPVEGGK